MRLGVLDWLIVAAMVIALAVVALVANRHTKSVVDYLAAGRTAGRYMMTMAQGIVWIGAINVVAMFELYHAAGFTAMWWVMLTTPFALYLNITGFGVYRFRETRALTVAQYLEVRYNRRVRVLAGLLAWTAGLINFGLFPAVGARFFIAFCGLPQQFEACGAVWPMFPVVMAGLLGVSLFFVLIGGHVAVIVTDCLQGLFTQIAALVMVVVRAITWLDWEKILEVMTIVGRPQEGRSLVDPFQAWNQAGGFTFWFFVIAIIGLWYNVLSNLQGQTYVASAKTAHEFRMGAALNQWRWQALLLFFMVLALTGMIVLYHPDHAATSQQIENRLDQLVADQPTAAAQDALRGQLIISTALSHVIPPGLMGLFCAMMVAALISTYDSFMHTWGAVFLQDVVMPFRRQPFATRRHLWLLRSSILGVALFAFAFSWIFPNPENILMYFALVNSIWLGGSGAVILGGLYWRRGTTAAAIWTLLLGAVLGIASIVVTVGWPYWFHEKFTLNPQWLFFITMVSSIAIYGGISVGGRSKFNLDKLLHRGQYAVEEDQTHIDMPVKRHERIFGIDREFSRFDRITAYLITGWYLAWLGVFLLGTGCALTVGITDPEWAAFWRIYLYILFALSIVTAIWFSIGGARDICSLFRALKHQERDYSDTGLIAHEVANDRPAASPGNRSSLTD